MGIDHGRDLTRAPQPTEVERLGLQDMHRVVLEQLGELLRRVEFSPVAMGTGERETSTTEPMIWCGTGSSNQPMRNGWQAVAERMAVATVKREWPSISSSTSSPTASRTASTRAIDRSSSYREMHALGGAEGVELSAV